ncbi:MAG: right-handed parallel beta-helix repeat-containing protein [Planctomycetota bacterium]
MLRLHIALVAAVSATALSAQSVVCVDQSGSGDFADLGSAVAAASAGDTILIKPGSYDGVAVDKALHLVADGPGVLVRSGMQITGIQAPDCVTVNGIAGNSGITFFGLTISDCSGTVWVDSYEANNLLFTGIFVTNSDRVILVDCEATGGRCAGLSVSDSNVFLQGGTFTGGQQDTTLDGLAGLEASNSTIDLVGTSLRGGNGGIFAGNVGDGGNGLELLAGSTVNARELDATGGAGGIDFLSMTFGAPGVPFEVDPSSSLSVAAGPTHDLEVDQIARVGDAVAYRVLGPAGHLVALNFAFDPDPFYLDLAQGSIVTGVPVVSVPLGSLGAAGSLVVPTTAGPLGLPDSLSLFVQVVALDPQAPAVYTGFGRPITLLSPGF